MYPARSPRQRRRFLAAILTFAAVLLFAGCSFSCSIGGDSTISADELATKVGESYTEETGIELESISCDEAAAEVGTAISCEATNASDVELTIGGEITAVSDDGDKVDFDWKVESARVPGENYAREAERVLEQQTGSPITSIECPERVDLVPGGEFRCTVVSPQGREYGATVSLTDSSGGFNVKVDSEPREGTNPDAQ